MPVVIPMLSGLSRHPLRSQGRSAARLTWSAEPKLPMSGGLWAVQRILKRTASSMETYWRLQQSRWVPDQIPVVDCCRVLKGLVLLRFLGIWFPCRVIPMLLLDASKENSDVSDLIAG